MFERLGRFTSRHWLLIIAFWVCLAAVLHSVAPRWDSVTHDGDLAYLPERMPSIQGELLLKEAFPNQKAKSQIAVVVERPDGRLSSDDLQVVDQLGDKLAQLQGDLPIVDTWTRSTEIVGDKLTSRVGPKGQATIILLQLSNEFMAFDNIRVLKRVLAEIDKTKEGEGFPAGLKLGVSGSAALGGEMLMSASESIQNTELTTVILVVVILMLVYRSPLLVLLPLVTIGVSLLVATDTLALLTQLNHVEGFEWWNFKVFTTTKIFIVVILFGAGTDFCLFLVSRFKEELAKGFSTSRAVGDSVGWVGHAVVGSAATTICGLGMMFFADFGKYRNSGPAIAVSLLITLVACITFAPALLQACGERIFWPWGVHRLRSAAACDSDDEPETTSSSGFWDWASRQILAHPGLILVTSIIVLLPLAYAGLSVQVTYDLLNELQANRPSVIGTHMVLNHFSAGELTPITLLAYAENGHFDQPEGEREIARLTKLIYDIPGVVSVRSIAEPLGDKPGFVQFFRSEGLKKLTARKHKFSKARYLTQVPEYQGKVARFDVVLEDEPFSHAAIAILDRVDRTLRSQSDDTDSAWHGARFEYVGATVGVRDLERITQSDRRLIERLTVLGVLTVLIVILRRPVVCVYLIVSVLFSYFVTIGATELIFGYMYGDSFFGLDWKVPIFLFVILIAVGEDYNIYLVTRVNEEQQRHGPLEGLRIAVARTGGIITSCGVIMAGTFISMLTGTLRGMIELGFALSLGVMLDTCVVRPILVPAFLALLDRRLERRAASPQKESTEGRPLIPARS